MVQRYIVVGDAVNFVDRCEEAKTDLQAVRTAFGEESIIISFTVTDPVAAAVITQHRDKYGVDLGWIDDVAPSGLADAPAIFEKLSFGSEHQTLNFAGH